MPAYHFGYQLGSTNEFPSHGLVSATPARVRSAKAPEFPAPLETIAPIRVIYRKEDFYGASGCDRLERRRKQVPSLSGLSHGLTAARKSPIDQHRSRGFNHVISLALHDYLKAPSVTC